MAMTFLTSEPARKHERPSWIGPRQRTLALRCAAVAACGLVAAACGSTPAPGTSNAGAPAGGAGSAAAGPGTAGSGTAGTAAAAKVSLTVDFAGSPTTPPAHYTLRCEPAGGSVADPAAVCAQLLRNASIFAPQPARIMCPMIMADAGHVTVTGTFLGRHVHETIVDGGCGLARWEKLRRIFG